LRYLREHEAEAGAPALLQLAGVDLQHLVEDAREDLGWHAHARVDHLLQRGEGVGRGCGLGEPRRKERWAGVVWGGRGGFHTSMTRMRRASGAAAAVSRGVCGTDTGFDCPVEYPEFPLSCP